MAKSKAERFHKNKQIARHLVRDLVHNYKEGTYHLFDWVVRTINNIPTIHLRPPEEVSEYRALLVQFDETGYYPKDAFTHLAERIAGHSISAPSETLELFCSVIRMRWMVHYRHLTAKARNAKVKAEMESSNIRHKSFIGVLDDALKILRGDDELRPRGYGDEMTIDRFHWPMISEAN